MAFNGRPGAQRSHGIARARHWVLLLAVTVSCLASAAVSRQAADSKQPGRYRFAPSTVLQMAQQLASRDYGVTRIPNDSPLRQLAYDQFRMIRVNRDSAVWRTEQVPFRMEVLPAGFLFTLPVHVSIVEGGIAREITATQTTFDIDPSVAKVLGNMQLPLSGMRLQTRLNSRSTWDEFAVFQGASYFRAVPKDAGYGLSARGLAIRTAHPKGEEFPEFTHYWVERPSSNSSGIVVHALLNSPSTTGAYRFSITPGAETIMDVDMTLFPRVALDNVGIATLTSMFLFDESERTRIDDFRDEVHDSDGLQLVLHSGEHVFRPLRNPTQLQISSFTSQAPRAFGLVQRSRRLSDFHDLEARYESRPSGWVEPTSEWGPGEVQLVEIPTDLETNDNIVAMWKPKEVIQPGKPWHTSYRLRWTKNPPRVMPSLGRATSTRTGPSSDGKRRLFVVEYVGAGRDIEGLKLDVGSSVGRLSNLALQPNRLTKGIRATFELTPGDSTVAELRMRVLRGDRPVTETWLYRWTAS
jgi:periplasmic glucans biosynthesis protein